MSKKTRLFIESLRDVSPQQWLESTIVRTVILDFFQAHPRTGFSHLTLSHAMDEKYSSTVIDAALWQLIQEGRISCRKTDNTRVYRLTGLVEYRPRNPFMMQ